MAEPRATTGASCPDPRLMRERAPGAPRRLLAIVAAAVLSSALGACRGEDASRPVASEAGSVAPPVATTDPATDGPAPAPAIAVAQSKAALTPARSSGAGSSSTRACRPARDELRELPRSGARVRRQQRLDHRRRARQPPGALRAAQHAVGALSAGTSPRFTSRWRTTTTVAPSRRSAASSGTAAPIRSPSSCEQPLLNPDEMNNRDAARDRARSSRARRYAARLPREFGRALDDAATTRAPRSARRSRRS